MGLGNPGCEYHLTPHNLGFLAVDQLAEDAGANVSRREGPALAGKTRIEGEEVVLAKPTTYMNLSGLAVSHLFERYGLGPQDLIVLVDEVALPLGTLRIRTRGSAGGHNGMKSVIGTIESDEFVRVRLGAQPERPIEDMVSYLLGRFREADLETVAGMLDQASEAVHVILKEGPQKAMNRFNRKVSSQQT